MTCANNDSAARTKMRAHLCILWHTMIYCIPLLLENMLFFTYFMLGEEYTVSAVEENIFKKRFALQYLLVLFYKIICTLTL